MSEKYVVRLKNAAIYHADNPFGSTSAEKLMRRGEMVLSDVNLCVAPGEFVYLIGRVGSGKSTLLKTLYAEVQLLSGEGRVAGYDLRRLRRRDIPYLRRRIGIVFQDYKLLTEAARAALPKEVSHKDAVYNLSRAALVPAAFCEGRHDLLAIATEDKLHQPYRMPLMPGSREVFALAKQCGAKAVYVSGAGSTVMAVAEKAEAEKFYSKLEKGLELLEGLDGCEAFTLLELDADNTGATVE